MEPTFRAAVWRGGDGLVVEELRLSGSLNSSEVLVRVTASTVTVSDYIPTRPENRASPGPLPQVLGHGGVGVVERVGPDVDRVKVGDRVLVLSTPQCGRCWFCVRGRAHWCAAFQFVGPAFATTTSGEAVHGSNTVGTFAEYAVVRDIQLFPTNTALPDDQLALLTVNYGSGVGSALVTAPVQPGSVAVAVGLGVSGLAYVQAARLAGATTVIGVDPHAHRRRSAIDRGATHVVDPDSTDPVVEVQRLGGDFEDFGARGADFVFDASATVEGIEQAWQMARITADVVLSSVTDDLASSVSFPTVPLTCFGKRIHSSQYGSFSILRHLPWAIGLMERGELDAGGLCEAEYRLDEVNQALTDVATHKILGATLVP